MLQIVIQIKRKQLKLILFTGSWERDVRTDGQADRQTDGQRDRDTFVSSAVFQLNFICYRGNFQSQLISAHLSLMPASCAAIGCSIFGRVVAISSQWQWADTAARHMSTERQTT